MKKIYVNSIEDLEKLHYLKCGSEYLIILDTDLDLKDCSIKPIDFENTNVIFDGNLHEIKNLSMHYPNENSVGLFNTYDSIMVVKDLRLTGTVEGNNNVGLLAGRFNGCINNCEFIGTVIGNDNIGGVVGISDDSLKLSDCRLDLWYGRLNKEIDASVGYVVGKSNQLYINACLYDVPCEELSGSYNQIKIRPKKVLKKSK